jgi:formyl-CoA transferase
MYLEMQHDALGVRKMQNAPFKLSETPAVNFRPSPLIGQHTREIVEGLLGFSHENCWRVMMTAPSGPKRDRAMRT